VKACMTAHVAVHAEERGTHEPPFQHGQGADRLELLPRHPPTNLGRHADAAVSPARPKHAPQAKPVGANR